jgi:hypothetical protein
MTNEIAAKTGRLLPLALLLASRPCLAADINQYGRQCADEIGVELPANMSCLDPNATVLPVTRDGTASAAMTDDCDKPALLEPGKACVPGARLVKYVQAAGEAVVNTTLLCRHSRTAGAAMTPAQLRDSPMFQDVGIIQYNESNHKTCWFYFVSAGKDSTSVPRPYAARPRAGELQQARAYFAPPSSTAGTRCIVCHDAGPWLRTPYVTQAKGTRNEVPPNNGETPLHVDAGGQMADWNGADGPKQITINTRAYLTTLSEEDRRAYAVARSTDAVAAVNKCTSCHVLGRSPQPGNARFGTCGYIGGSAMGRPVANDHLRVPAGGRIPWMAPNHGLGAAQWAAYYAYAARAVEECCANPNLRNAAGDLVCR